MRRVFDGQHLRATLINPDLPKLMVTFDFRKDGKTTFGKVPNRAIFAESGFAVLSIKTRANDWFINADTQTLETTLREVRKPYAQVNMLGYSMGGYGAFRFADALTATAVVAVSPQFSIAPEVVPFENRFREEAMHFDVALSDLTWCATSNLCGVIVVDPFLPRDMVHAAMLQTIYPELEIARLCGGGHPATQVLRDLAATGVIPQAACETRPTAAPILTVHRARRAQSARYWNRLRGYCADRRPGLAAVAQAREDAIGA